MNSCASVLGLILLVITDLGGIIAFATPYWIIYNTAFFPKSFHNFGLWATCSESNCQWVFQENGSKINGSEWFIAVQGLMAVGLCTALIALLIATIALCCQCQNCNYAGTVAGLLLTTFLAMGVGVTLFGIKASEQNEYNADLNFETSSAKFGWSFWMTAGSAVMALLTSFVYGCSSRNN